MVRAAAFSPLSFGLGLSLAVFLALNARADFGLARLVSKSSGAQAANQDSYRCAVSSNGRYVAFESKATNLLASSSNPSLYRQIFIFDNWLSRTEEISKSSAPSNTESNGDNNSVGISSDGRYVVFDSAATNLVAGDTNNALDVFLRDRTSNTTELVSKTYSGGQGDADSQEPDVSANGRYVVFKSVASNMVAADKNFVADIFLRDRQAATTIRVSEKLDHSDADYDSTAGSPAISADGRYIVFGSRATNLTASDTNGMSADVFRYDRTSRAIVLVSVNTSGSQFSCDSSSVGPGSISSDGRYVVFTTDCNPDTPRQVYVRDMQASVSELISRDDSATAGNDDSGDLVSGAKISADGRYVAFSSRASNIMAGLPDNTRRIFLADRGGSPRLTLLDEPADRHCLSADGTAVGYRKSSPSPRLTYLRQVDQCPSDANKESPGMCGCGATDSDTDGDSVADCIDGCPTDANKSSAGRCGCGVAETDSDGDGTPNCVDNCPSDRNKTEPGTCGCGISDTDSDHDGIANCLDACPTDANKTSPGACGCGFADVDTDNDGALDCVDGCPLDSQKLAAGVCGCGSTDIDTDHDGTLDCLDSCPSDPQKLDAGSCGCGVLEDDSNSDGTLDCVLGARIKLKLSTIETTLKKLAKPTTSRQSTIMSARVKIIKKLLTHVQNMSRRSPELVGTPNLAARTSNTVNAVTKALNYSSSSFLKNRRSALRALRGLKAILA